MTIGDVLAAIAAILAVGGAWIATLILTALAFPSRTARAHDSLLASPGACLARGAGITLAVALCALTVGHGHTGPTRLVSGALWACLGMLAAIGSAGIVQLLGERITDIGARMSPFSCLTRGAIVYVAAGFLPIVGWLLIAPIALLLSVGSGAATLGRRRSQDASLPEINCAAALPRESTEASA